ncbi:Crp/Fnr family transcriptional regulator [Sphingosinicella sp. LHD-64]|uniref:Crp/Fnr family transcriptional regulator n=1 Tax=Sphingosinicella sp. LHD-64 TaxID=3072139 RepID=UPI00280CB4EC|nr:Crp/Fnr family transcriptional regulator [Sphingosinicella sp. LHD-64]MDQ8756040.1 Crp/Fnr family transcriptional regulator [Sphingosinicella sp. LHD-64]
MGAEGLAERFGKHARLTASEQAALDRFEEQQRSYRRGAVVIREQENARELFVVRSGWLHSSVVLGNGSRQITRFHFPGDLVGLPLLAFPDSPETVTAVTDIVLHPFGRERVGALIAEHPRLGALLLSLAVADRVAFADRIASLGRTPARTRVAALLCEIYMRMRGLGTAEGGPIPLPLTQEDIGDATGLTAVHVNRMMRVLAEDRIIERRGGMFRVLDEARLCADAGFLDRSPVETGWLPPPR